MLSHSIERFYIVIYLIVPNMDDIKISTTTVDINCSYLNVQLDSSMHAVKHIPNMKNFYTKIVPYV